MAKTLSDVQTEVRTYLDESSQLDFLDSEVNASINRAYHDVIGSVIEIYEDWYEVTTPYAYAIVANQQEYSIDSSLIKVTRVEINYNPTSSNTIPSRATPIKEDEVRGNLGNTSNIGSFFSAAYYLHGNIGAQKIGFIPVPQTADTTGKSISVWGVSLPSDLSVSTDNVNIPYADRFAYLIALKASAQLLRKGQQEEAVASRYIAEYEAGLIKLKNFLKDRQADDGQYIVDSEIDQIDFQTTVI